MENTQREVFSNQLEYSDVAAMLEACQIELVKSGFSQEANLISGLEVFTSDDAAVAAETLAQLRVEHPNIRPAIRYTIAMLRRLSQPAELAS